MTARPFPIGVLGIHRARKEDSFDDRDKNRVAIVLPRLVRALQIQHGLSAANIAHRVALDALDRTQTATLVVSDNGRVIYCEPPRRIAAASAGRPTIGK